MCFIELQFIKKKKKNWVCYVCCNGWMSVNFGFDFEGDVIHNDGPVDDDDDYGGGDWCYEGGSRSVWRKEMKGLYNFKL